jgi:hypothetical protein
MHSSNHIEHCRNNCITSHAKKKKHGYTSAQCICNWNTWVSGHKQGTVAFPQRKPLSKPTENSTVSICTYILHNSVLHRLSPPVVDFQYFYVFSKFPSGLASLSFRFTNG